MKAFATSVSIHTQGKGTYSLTQKLEEIVAQSDVQTGTATVFVQHTSCSLIIMECADPAARNDLHQFFEHLVPEDIPYFVHTYEGKDDMPAHVRMVLTGCSEVIPIIRGKLALGTWQGVYLFEHRSLAHKRNIAVSILGK